MLAGRNAEKLDALAEELGGGVAGAPVGLDDPEASATCCADAPP